jgi:glycosyltransferase involved in cell wall biosynthesis
VKVGVIPSRTKTGEGRYSEVLINGLRKTGITVDVLASRVFRRPNEKVCLGSIALERIIRGKNLSIVHNLDNLGPFLLRKAKDDTKTVLTVHDIAPVILPHEHSAIVRFDFQILLPRLIRNCDQIIVVSESTKNDIITRFKINQDMIEVIPLGIDRSVFYPRNTDREILGRYNVSGEYILYVGTDVPRKNLPNLVRAFANIADKIPHHLVLVGPIRKKMIEKLIFKMPINWKMKNELMSRIIVVGYIDFKDLPTIYSAASVLVLPSLYEGFGFPPLEAMSCGTPVIVSSNSSLKETVNNCGVYIHNPSDVEEISELIKKVLDDQNLRSNLSKLGIQNAKRFTWEKTVSDTIRVYEKILTNNFTA